MSVNVAIIGAGDVANLIHVPTWKKLKGVNVVGVYDVDALKSERFAKKFRIIPFTDMDDVLNSDADLIDICTPIHTHYEIAKQILENGKHVLIEKPLAASSNDAKYLVNLSKKKNLSLVVNQNHIYSSAMRGMRELIEKEFGELLYISIDWFISTYKPNHWTCMPETGGLFFELGVHPFYMARYLFGKADEVHCFGRLPSKNEMVGYVNTTIKRGESLCNIQLLPYIYQPTIKAFGAKGSAVVHVFPNVLVNEKTKLEKELVSLCMVSMIKFGLEHAVDFLSCSRRVFFGYVKRGANFILNSQSAINQYNVFKYVMKVVNGLHVNKPPGFYLDVAVDSIAWLERCRAQLEA